MIPKEEQPLEQSEALLLQADRRRAERYPCDLQPFWHLEGGGLAPASQASVRDVSATGLGLRVAQRLKPGTVLVLELQAPNQRLSRPLPVRVMHATPQEDGGWLLGCQFVRALSGQDLRALLDPD